MVASPRNTDPKSLKRRGSYYETTKQIKLPTPTVNFRLFPTVRQCINWGCSKNIIRPFIPLLTTLNTITKKVLAE